MSTSQDLPILFKREEIEQSIPARFARQVAKHGSRLAVHTYDVSLTYEQLDTTANQIANQITGKLGFETEPVALCFESSAMAISAILGTLKAGKIWVPLDPTLPDALIRDILADCRPNLIISDNRTYPLACKVSGTPETVINVDRLDRTRGPGDPNLSISPHTPAYIFYTSGSTGKPKGVVDSHRNVLHNIMRYTNTLGINPDDRLSLIQSLSFSGIVSSLFGALLNGAAILPFNLRDEGVNRVAEWVSRAQVTIYHSVPSLFRHLSSGSFTYPRLRLIRLEGDQAHPRDVALYQRKFAARCVLVNGFGATECGLVRQYFIDRQTAFDGSIVPVGYPVVDMHVVLLDHDGDEVALGEVGEIAVHSRFLATGYWGRPDLTRTGFLPNADDPELRLYRTGDLGRLRPDGCLEYLGRRDFEMKIRGHRVYV
ncbi:MAG: AMP-binding protein, partial [Gammaproteobacteria bacterium]|nr:AMP-binding protein [Gammaproteobacteria bacterium]